MWFVDGSVDFTHEAAPGLHTALVPATKPGHASPGRNADSSQAEPPPAGSPVIDHSGSDGLVVLLDHAAVVLLRS